MIVTASVAVLLFIVFATVALFVGDDGAFGMGRMFVMLSVSFPVALFGLWQLAEILIYVWAHLHWGSP